MLAGQAGVSVDESFSQLCRYIGADALRVMTHLICHDVGTSWNG